MSICQDWDAVGIKRGHAHLPEGFREIALGFVTLQDLACNTVETGAKVVFPFWWTNGTVSGSIPKKLI